MPSSTFIPRVRYATNSRVELSPEGRRVRSKPADRSSERSSEQLHNVRNELVRRIIDKEIATDLFAGDRDGRGLRRTISELALILGLHPDRVRTLVRQAREVKDQLAVAGHDEPEACA